MFRLEEEVKKMSPQGEELMILSDIREESECEDMSTKGDDEDDVQSTSEVRYNHRNLHLEIFVIDSYN